jgi:hypothetical protein
MKNIIAMMVLGTLVVSCGVDKGEPNSLNGAGNGGNEQSVFTGYARVIAASFGDYNEFINPHPETRRDSLYRLYKKDGRKYIPQEGYANEVELQGSFKLNANDTDENDNEENVEETFFKLILYKERLSSSKVGEFSYWEKDGEEYKKIGLSKTEFRSLKSDDYPAPFLQLKLFKNDELFKVFHISLDRETKVLSIENIDDTKEQKEASPLTIVKKDNEELKELGDYIKDTMMKKSSCKKVTAGNIVAISNYTTIANRGLEYRKCYWDLYDESLNEFVKAHKQAVEDGDRRGSMCLGSVFSKIKKNLVSKQNDCKTTYGE